MILVILSGVVIGLVLLLYYLTTPREEHVRAVPADFPKSIPVYDEKNIDQITITAVGTLPAPLQGLVTFLNKHFVRLPIQDKARTDIQVEWRELSAKPEFLIDYYNTALQKNFFITSIDFERDSGAPYRINFSKGDVNGQFIIRDNKTTPSTDRATLMVILPSKTN